MTPNLDTTYAASVPDATHPLPAPQEVLGVSECQAGLADLTKTPVLGTAGMSPCSAAFLVDTQNNRGLILHVTTPGAMQGVNPAVGSFLGIQGANDMAPDALEKAIQAELQTRAQNNPGNPIKLITVAGREGQENYDKHLAGIKDNEGNTPKQIMDHFAALDPGHAISHEGHSVGSDCMLDTRDDRLFVRNARDANPSFDPKNYDWGPYSKTKPSEAIGGSPLHLNRMARGDGQKAELMFMAQDNATPGFEQAQRAKAAEIVAKGAVNMAFKDANPAPSDQRKAQLEKLIKDSLVNNPEFVGNHALQHEVVRGYHANTALSSSSLAITPAMKTEVADKSLMVKLADLTKTSLDQNDKLGQTPGSLRQMLNPGHTQQVNQAGQNFQAEIAKLAGDHDLEKKSLTQPKPAPALARRESVGDASGLRLSRSSSDLNLSQGRSIK
jgi:hypothetical protein